MSLLFQNGLKVASKMNIRAACRYAFIGMVQNGLSYCITLLLIAIGWHAWEAVLVLTPPAIVLTFLLNKNWSFQSSRPRSGQFGKYVAVYAMSYVFAVALTWALEHAGVPSWLAALLTTGTAAVGVYCLLNFWIFIEPKSVDE